METDKEFIWNLFLEYEKFVTKYGPFSYLHPHKIPTTEPNLIWSSAFGGHILNGYSDSSSVDWYLISDKPFTEQPFEIDVIEVHLFECPDCEGEGTCNLCDEDGMCEIDFERFEASTPPEDRNLDSLFDFRKPFGFEYP